jgi:hypothetical protein
LVKFGKDAAAAAAEGARISNILNDVEDAERELIVQRARANKQIIEARFIADDLTKSTEERIKAVQRASKLEDQVATKELKYARQKAKALEEQAAISEVTEDQLVAIAEAQARVLDLEADSIRRQKRLQSEIKSLRNEEKTQLEEIDKVRKESVDKEAAYQKFLSGGEKEYLDTINKRAAARVQALSDFTTALDKVKGISQTERQKELEQLRQDGLAAMRILLENGLGASNQAAQLLTAQRDREKQINEKYDKEDKKRQLANNAKKLELAGQAFGALAQLVDSFSKGDEENAKRAFGITKALRLGEAVANTAAAIMNQLAVPQDAPSGANFVKAGIVAITGAAQIATIARSKYQSTATPPTPPSTSSGGGAAGGGGFTPNISFTGIGQNPLSGIFDRPMQAYVVNQQMNNNNMLERRIRTSANFGG